MANTYFQFKQFRIEQDRCSMKVGTDACILGAYFAERIAPHSRVLDVGSGTGLLLLMLAQKISGIMDGIEVEPACYSQLNENICSSHWKDRLHAIDGDVRQFNSAGKYDFIISNPPFYEDDLPSPSQQKNIAKHSSHLTLEELILAIERMLDPLGSFGVLLPAHRSSFFEELASKKKFHLIEKLSVSQTPGHHAFRNILHFSRNRTRELSETNLTIFAEPSLYSTEFRSLMKDYYLHL